MINLRLLRIPEKCQVLNDLSKEYEAFDVKAIVPKFQHVDGDTTSLTISYKDKYLTDTVNVSVNIPGVSMLAINCITQYHQETFGRLPIEDVILVNMMQLLTELRETIGIERTNTFALLDASEYLIKKALKEL